MNKVIIKTAIVTVLSLIVASILAGIGIYAFAPRFAGDCCYELGLKNMATSCYERVYQKTGTYDDLIELVNSAIYAEDDKNVSVYGEELVNRKIEFNAFCEQADFDKEFEEGSFTTYDYYVNTTVFAKYYLGYKQDAVDFAFSCLFKGGYVENSALKMLVEMVDSEEGLGNMLVIAYNALEPANRYAFTNHNVFRSDMKELGYTLS